MSYMARSWPAGQQKQKLLENLLTEYGAMADRTAQSEVKQEPPAETTNQSSHFDPLGPFAQQPVDDQFRPSETPLQTAEWPITQPPATATSLYNIFENASYGSQTDFLSNHMDPPVPAPSFAPTQYVQASATQQPVQRRSSITHTHQNPPFVQAMTSQHNQPAFEEHFQ